MLAGLVAPPRRLGAGPGVGGLWAWVLAGPGGLVLAALALRAPRSRR